MVPDKINKGRCNLCGSEFYKGINLLKQHIAGIRENMESCNENTLLDSYIQDNFTCDQKKKREYKEAYSRIQR